jgi:transposase
VKADSDDLRRKVVDAVERGLNKCEAARLFGVSLSSAKRYAKMAREGRPLAPRKAPGRRPKIDQRGKRLLEDYLEKHPAAFLSERRQFLERVIGMRVRESMISRLPKRLGFSRKKGRWARASGRVAEGQVALALTRIPNSGVAQDLRQQLSDDNWRVVR